MQTLRDKEYIHGNGEGENAAEPPWGVHVDVGIRRIILPHCVRHASLSFHCLLVVRRTRT